MKDCLKPSTSSKLKSSCRAPVAPFLRRRFATIPRWAPSTSSAEAVARPGWTSLELSYFACWARTGDPTAVQLRSVYLDPLKSRMPFASDPGDGLRHVAVTLLRLSDADGSFGRITLEVGSGAEDDDIWTRTSEWFEDFDPLSYANWSVTRATLRIEFHPENEGGPAKVMTVDLRTPHGTNLKDLPRRYATIVEKNLLRWGLLQDATT